MAELPENKTDLLEYPTGLQRWTMADHRSAFQIFQSWGAVDVISLGYRPDLDLHPVALKMPDGLWRYGHSHRQSLYCDESRTFESAEAVMDRNKITAPRESS